MGDHCSGVYILKIPYNRLAYALGNYFAILFQLEFYYFYSIDMWNIGIKINNIE